MNDPNIPGPDDVLEQAAAWKADGDAVALATVVATWGSSPRPVGSQLAIKGDGAFVGSAVDVIRDNTVRNLDFGVTDEMAWEVGLACGGEIKIFVEKLD